MCMVASFSPDNHTETDTFENSFLYPMRDDPIAVYSVCEIEEDILDGAMF